jgi:hypothetical protein
MVLMSLKIAAARRIDVFPTQTRVTDESAAQGIPERSFGAVFLQIRKTRRYRILSLAAGQTPPAAAEGWAIGFRARSAKILVMVWAIAADEPPATPTAITPAAKSADSLKTIAVESATVTAVESHRAGRHCHGQRQRARQ